MSVDWSVEELPAGVNVTPSSGALHLTGETAGHTCGAARDATVTLSLTAAAAGTFPVRIELRTPGGAELPPVVLDVTAQP